MNPAIPLEPRLMAHEEIAAAWKKANDQGEALVRFARLVEAATRGKACQIINEASDECHHRNRGKADICGPCLASALDNIVNKRRLA